MLRCFGDKLRYLRQQHRITQNELAQRLGLIAQGQISLLENGRRQPSLSVVVAITSLFGLTTDYLLQDDLPIEVESTYRADDSIVEVQPVRLFAAKLRQLRVQHQLTQIDLMQRIPPYTQAHISQLERGYSEPSIELSLDLARLFQVSTDYLLLDSIPVEDHSSPISESRFLAE
jgi:transcriptional regulator with XRE-family HTH domain